MSYPEHFLEDDTDPAEIGKGCLLPDAEVTEEAETDEE